MGKTYKDFFIGDGKAFFSQTSLSNSYSYSLVLSSQFNIKGLEDFNIAASIHSSFFAGANVNLIYAKKPAFLQKLSKWSCNFVGKYSKGNVPRSSTVYSCINANTGIYHSCHSFDYKAVGSLSIIAKPEKVNSFYKNTAIVIANLVAIGAVATSLPAIWNNACKLAQIGNALLVGASTCVLSFMVNRINISSTQDAAAIRNNPAIIMASDKSTINSADEVFIKNSANDNGSIKLNSENIAFKASDKIELAFGSDSRDKSIIDVKNDEISINFGDNSKISIKNNNVVFSNKDTNIIITNKDINFSVSNMKAMAITSNALSAHGFTMDKDKIVISK